MGRAGQADSCEYRPSFCCHATLNSPIVFAMGREITGDVNLTTE
ncbi:hypothetical protein CCHR01_17827 [Colletotrichum chrysophilum]|uniref:Uncharacterized protein n=1 Tax=Colletotrichum chrysophilum TaxID=1836956 RepID=A0AAD9A2T7_9PEZI|nr:hypothetical protein CCHR01_17827 [Colletotrichum chrysophilum]